MYKNFANRRLSIGLITTLIVFGIWYLFSFVNIAKGTIPSPFVVVKLLFSGEIFEILKRLLITLSNVFTVLFISTILGYIIGLICGLNKYVHSLLYPVLNSVKSIPITVLLPVFIAIFHLKYFLFPLISLPLIANLSVNISQAIKNINENRLNIVSLMGISQGNVIKHIYFWETVEPLMATMRILVTYALTIEIALDYFLSTSQGIGSYIFQQYNSYSPDKYSFMFAGILIVSFLGILSIKLVDLTSSKLVKWKEKV